MSGRSAQAGSASSGDHPEISRPGGFPLSDILHANPDIIAVINADGRVKYINEAGCRLLGVVHDDLIDARWPDLVHPDDRPLLSELWPMVLASEEANEARYRVRGADGNPLWLDTRMRSMRMATGTPGDDVVISAREATLQIQLEQALQKAKEDAEKADRAKSEFLSRMSHELRTPLNAILGFAQLLEMDELDADQDESVREIRRSGAHLLELIDEVLDISRIESGKGRLEIAPTSLLTVLDQSISMVKPLASEGGVVLDVDLPTIDVYVSADAQRLKQVVLNLLSNAIKYNQPGGSVRTTIEVSDGRVRVPVCDTGKGIAPEMTDRLFSPFDRLGAERSGTSGTGLGLVLSKKLVEAMDGSLEVSSEPGRGSTFTIDLPLAESPQVDQNHKERPTTHTDGCILYIEDDPANLRLVERLIGKHRPQTTLMTAMQGATGLDLARLHRPILILLDVNLADMDGGDVLLRLKDDPATRSIRVLMVSADASKEKTEAMLALGADGYLTKPLNVDLLLESIDDAVGRANGVGPG